MKNGEHIESIIEYNGLCIFNKCNECNKELKECCYNNIGNKDYRRLKISFAKKLLKRSTITEKISEVLG